MFLKPNPIAHVDVAAAERAFPEVPGLVEWRPADLPAGHRPARPRLVDGHDRGHVHLSKNMAPESLPRPNSIGAGCAAIVVSYRHGDRRCQTANGDFAPRKAIDANCAKPRSFYLNGDLLGAIAQAALEGADLWPVWSRYHACQHHRPVAFRAWRPFNFNRAAIS
jgi:hypothetical protein